MSGLADRTRLMEEFKTMAAFDSESCRERDLAAYLYRKLEGYGLDVSMDDAGSHILANEKAAGNIYGYLKGNTDGTPVLFSAHMDTVAPGNGKKVCVSEDGRVTSDGTTVLGADDITGIAAILEMLAVIREKNLPHPDIEVVFFVAEELYCRGSARFDFSRIRARQAYVLDLDGEIGKAANRAPSIYQFKVSVTGKRAHAGFEPELGISAIQAAAHGIGRLKLGRIDDVTTANIGTINGGTGKNIIPDKAVIEGEVRSLEDRKAAAALEMIRKTFADAASYYGATAEFEICEMVKAYHVPREAQVIRRYEQALRELGYGEMQVVTTFGGSDNNQFNKHGIEGIVIANAMNKVHTTGEYFYVDQLVKSAEIVIKLAQ